MLILADVFFIIRVIATWLEIHVRIMACKSYVWQSVNVCGKVKLIPVYTLPFCMHRHKALSWSAMDVLE